MTIEELERELAAAYRYERLAWRELRDARECVVALREENAALREEVRSLRNTGEAEADDEIRRGEARTFDDPAEALKWLDSPEKEEHE